MEGEPGMFIRFSNTTDRPGEGKRFSDEKQAYRTYPEQEERQQGPHRPTEGARALAHQKLPHRYADPFGDGSSPLTESSWTRIPLRGRREGVMNKKEEIFLPNRCSPLQITT